MHLHTVCSDGYHTVPDVLSLAQEQGLSLISISDHDKINAYEQIKNCRQSFSGGILPAVELTCTIDGEVCEILGYGIDLEKMKKLMPNFIVEMDTVYREAVFNVNALLENGLILSKELIEARDKNPSSLFFEVQNGIKRKIPGGARQLILDDMKKHKENARFFNSEAEFKTIVRTVFARQYMFNPESPLYINASSCYANAQKVVEAIHQSGGLAFLAHPFSYSPHAISMLENTVKKLSLDGCECEYATFTSEQKEFMHNFCDEHNLFKSGGSDFHGLAARPQNIMGFSNGERIKKELIFDWLPLIKDKII